MRPDKAGDPVAVDPSGIESNFKPLLLGVVIDRSDAVGPDQDLADS